MSAWVRDTDIKCNNECLIFMLAVKVSIIRRMVALTTVFLSTRPANEIDRDYQIIH